MLLKPTLLGKKTHKKNTTQQQHKSNIPQGLQNTYQVKITQTWECKQISKKKITYDVQLWSPTIDIKPHVTRVQHCYCLWQEHINPAKPCLSWLLSNCLTFEDIF